MTAFMSFALILLAIGAVTSKAVHFQNCPSQKLLGEILSVRVSPCEDDPCVFNHGTNVTITVTFIPREVITSGRIFVYAIRRGKYFPLPLPNNNACKGYGLTCPSKRGVPVQLAITQQVPDYSTPGSYFLEVVLVDQKVAIVICGIFDFKIA